MRSSDPFSHPRDQSLGQGNAAYLVSPNWQPRPMSRTASIRAAVEKRTNEFAAGLRWRGIVGSAIIGAIVGATIMTTGAIIEAMLDVVLELDAIWHVVLPLLGLAAATWILRRPPAQSPATADAYIASFHDNGQRLGGWAMIRRIWASVVSLGSGVPLGFEGPSIYIGATIGALIRRRMSRLLHGTDARAFLAAGAAGAGMAEGRDAPPNASAPARHRCPSILGGWRRGRRVGGVSSSGHRGDLRVRGAVSIRCRTSRRAARDDRSG